MVSLEELLYSLDSPDFASFHVTPDIDEIDMHPVKEEKNFFVHFGPRQRKPGLTRKRVIQQLVRNLPEIKKKKRSIFGGVKNNKPKVPKTPQVPVEEEPSERYNEEDGVRVGRPIDAASPERRRKLIDDVIENLPDLFYDVSDVESLYAQLPRSEEDVSKSDRPVEEAVIGKTSVRPAENQPPPPGEVGYHSNSRASSAEPPPMLPGSSPPTRHMRYRNDSFSDDSLSVISDAPPPLPSMPPPPHNPSSSFPFSRQTSSIPFHSRTSSFESDELNHPAVFTPSMEPVTPTNADFVPGYPSSSTNSSQDFVTQSPITPTNASQDFAPQSLLHPSTNQPQRPSSFDSGTDTISTPDHETDAALSVPESLRLPETPPRNPAATPAPPAPLPKPETPLWLKKMMDWQHTEKEKELSEVKKLKARLQQLQIQDEVILIFHSFNL